MNGNGKEPEPLPAGDDPFTLEPGSSPRTVVVKTVCGPILFRLPDVLDYYEAFHGIHVLQLTPAEAHLAAENLTSPELLGQYRDMVTGYDRILIACAKRPKLTAEDVVSDDSLWDIHDLPSLDRLRIGLALLQRAGASKREAAKIDPLEPTTTP